VKLLSIAVRVPLISNRLYVGHASGYSQKHGFWIDESLDDCRGSGVLGSFVGFFLAFFGKGNTNLRVENTTGIGVLVGASIGTLIGIFSSMLDRI